MKGPTKGELEAQLAKTEALLASVQSERDDYKRMVAVFIKAGQDARTAKPAQMAFILISAYTEAFKK